MAVLLAGMVGVVAACGNSEKGTANSGPADSGVPMWMVVDESEFERFAREANLTPEQRAAIVEHLRRFELQYPGIKDNPDLLPALIQHFRTLILSELNPEQLPVYDDANLPGSISWVPPA